MERSEWSVEMFADIITDQPEWYEATEDNVAADAALLALSPQLLAVLRKMLERPDNIETITEARKLLFELEAR